MELAKTHLPPYPKTPSQTTSQPTCWETAYQRVNYYLYLNRVPVNQQQQIMQDITHKAEQHWQHITEENQLISLFIEEAQHLLHLNKTPSHSEPDRSSKASLTTVAYYTQAGRLRTSTGPNIHRCSIRPAVLEKISVRRKRTARHH
jgi:hypothetical protein